MKTWILIFSASLVLGGVFVLRPASGGADDTTLVIIAHPSVPVSRLSANEVRQIFLKERTNWPGGGKIVLMNAKSGSPERAAFQAKVLGMDDSAEKAYWQKQKIKKGLTPPPEISNTQRGVFSLQQSLSYCLKSQYKTGTSKVLLTL